jgi:oligopeptide/dipeptide ABC transporter ATP-binding protein
MGGQVRCHYPLADPDRDARMAADGLLGAIPKPNSARPLHPIPRALLAATPGLTGRRHAQAVPKGELPSGLDPSKGCAFSTRCPHAAERCPEERPGLRTIDGRQAAGHFAERFQDQ